MAKIIRELNDAFSQIDSEIRRARSGQGIQKFEGPLDMNGNKISNVGNPNDPGDALNRRYAEATFSKKVDVSGENALVAYYFSRVA
jgi:hypothetical protein